MGERRPLTTRRGFIIGTSFGVASLYGLWAALGAAPLPFLGAHPEVAPDAGHGGGHGSEPAAPAAGHGGAGGGPKPEEFRRLTEDFVALHQAPDGSVSLVGPSPAAAGPGGHGQSHAGHGQPMPAMVAADAGPGEVYLMAYQWGYAPAVLRLAAGVPYRFKMMAVDASHGASLNLGAGSRVVRLRRGVLVEQEMTFLRPGEYLVYCTVYCGLAHDRMSGKIVVA